MVCHTGRMQLQRSAAGVSRRDGRVTANLKSARNKLLRERWPRHRIPVYLVNCESAGSSGCHGWAWNRESAARHGRDPRAVDERGAKAERAIRPYRLRRISARRGQLPAQPVPASHVRIADFGRSVDAGVPVLRSHRALYRSPGRSERDLPAPLHPAGPGALAGGQPFAAGRARSLASRRPRQPRTVVSGWHAPDGLVIE